MKEHWLETYKSLITLSIEGFKFSALANGGSAVALLAYLGNVAGKSVPTGRFLRYPSIASALRDVTHSSGWYFSQDMKHETKTDYEEARKDVTTSFGKLIAAIDETLKSAPRRL